MIIAEAELLEDRAEAEERMESRARLLRPTNRMAQDEATGRQYRVWVVLAIDVPVRVAGPARSATQTRTQAVPGGEIQVAHPIDHLPLEIKWLDAIALEDRELRDDDHIDVTAGEPAGLAHKILEADLSDQKTARHLPVKAVQRPEEWDL